MSIPLALLQVFNVLLVVGKGPDFSVRLRVSQNIRGADCESAQANLTRSEEVVLIDGGGFFYGSDNPAPAAFHASLLAKYDAYGLNALYVCNPSPPFLLTLPPF